MLWRLWRSLPWVKPGETQPRLWRRQRRRQRSRRHSAAGARARGGAAAVAAARLARAAWGEMWISCLKRKHVAGSQRQQVQRAKQRRRQRQPVKAAAAGPSAAARKTAGSAATLVRPPRLVHPPLRRLAHRQHQARNKRLTRRLPQLPANCRLCLATRCTPLRPLRCTAAAQQLLWPGPAAAQRRLRRCWSQLRPWLCR